MEPFEEVLPRELPACSRLRFMGPMVSRSTLLLLGMCSLPKLQTLWLRVLPGEVAKMSTRDLAWLPELPELRSVCFGVEGRNLMWAEDEEEAEEVQELEWLMEDAAAVLHWL